MKVLGVSTGRQAAAALSIDGRVVSAAIEALSGTIRSDDGWPRAAARACLREAGVGFAELDRVTVVLSTDCPDVPADWLGAPIRAQQASIGPLEADARQIVTAFPSERGLVYLAGFERDSHALFQQCGTTFKSAVAPTGAEALAGLCELVRTSTGCDWRSIAPVHGAVAFSEPFERALRWDEQSGFISDPAALQEVLCEMTRLRAAVEDPAHSAEYQQLAQSVAAAFLRRLQSLVVESAQRQRQLTGNQRIGFGGALFSLTAFATAVVDAFGSDAVLAPAPEHAGRALGAALHDAPGHEQPIGTLALGPSYSEQDVKATLDSCRLTYVYEPEWGRLRGRVSRILSSGMLVAWFQGAAGFGSSAVGGRVVVSDPSNRWARENVNRFFRQVPVDIPIPLVAAAGEAPWHAGETRRFTRQRLPVDAGWRTQVGGAIDRHGCVEVQGISAADDVQLIELIREHDARTRVPALVAVPFSAPADPVVGTPRDAIRTMFSSPIDVLVIERFVVAKDYWLLGTQAS